MKLFLFATILSLLFSVEETIYIKSTLIRKHSIIINFSDSSFLKCKIKKENSRRYFFLEDNMKVYLDVEQEAKWKQNIDSLFKANTVRPESLPGYLPIIYLVFIVDENGKIIHHGLDREFQQDDYQKEIFRLMTLINCRFEPAIVNGKNAPSVLKLQINYYQLFKN